MGTNNARTASAALTQALFDFIEDYRWLHRKKRSEILVEALEDWAVKQGFNAEIDPTDGGH